MADITEEKKRKVNPIIIILLLLIIVLGAVVALIKFDVAGLGTKVVGPAIKDIPGASYILPEMPEEVDESLDIYRTKEEVEEILKVTEDRLNEKVEEADNLNEQLKDALAEVERLKAFEENYIQYEADKKALDEGIVGATDSASFAEWYERTSPENAEEIYREIKGEAIVDEKRQELITLIGNMDEEPAAKMIEELSYTRMEMVADILRNLESEKAASLLNLIDQTAATRIAVYLYPGE